jgi:hypothetical protein
VALHPYGTLDRGTQAELVHWLEQVIYRTSLERLDGMPIERRNYHYHGRMLSNEIAYHFETAHHRHLQVEKDRIGLQLFDLQQSVSAVIGFSHYLDIG